MAASSNSRSKNNRNTTKNTNAPVLTFSFSSSMSPSMASSHPSDPFPSSSFASSSSSSMASSIFNNRPSSPTRVNLSPSLSSSSSSSLQAFRISLNNHNGNRSLSPNSRSVSVRDQVVPRRPSLPAAVKKTCMCSPTNHPGSFRCAYHRKGGGGGSGGGGGAAAHHSPSPIRLNLRRSAMTNSLVRIGTVEGDWVRRALTALIRPSSHQQRRRGSFEPRPSRLSVMSKAAD